MEIPPTHWNPEHTMKYNKLDEHITK